jgi:hypothetical protein
VRLIEFDSEHLSFAAERNAVLFSFNMGDYCRLHEEWLQQGREHAGIIVAQQQTLPLGERRRPGGSPYRRDSPA